MDTYEQYKAQFKAVIRQAAPHDNLYKLPLTTQEEVAFEALTRPLESR